jgi:hypothetical protein
LATWSEGNVFYEMASNDASKCSVSTSGVNIMDSTAAADAVRAYFATAGNLVRIQHSLTTYNWRKQTSTQTVLFRRRNPIIRYGSRQPTKAHSMAATTGWSGWTGLCTCYL